MNNFNIPFAWPFKMYKNGNTGMHFDDQWYCRQIKSFELRALYKQKWVKQYTTPLQIESSLAPEDLKLLDKYGQEVKSFEWVQTGIASGDIRIWETVYDVSDMTDGTYYLYQQVTFGEINWEAISEPIMIAVSHVNVKRFTYWNTFNKDDVAWITGIKMTFMCEADIQDFEPDMDETDFVDETRDTETLFATPSRQFQLYVGDTRNGVSGVAPYMVDILNRVFSCDRVEIEDKRYDNKSGSKFKITRVRGYPLIGASLDLVESQNSMSLQFADTTPFTPGFIAAYNIDTGGFFGPGSVVPVIDIDNE